MQVWIRETNESEPPLTRRNPETCRRNQGRFYLLGSARRILGYWAGGDRRIGGVNLIRALVRECGNQSVFPMSKGEATSGINARGESTDAEHWDDRIRKKDEGPVMPAGA